MFMLQAMTTFALTLIALGFGIFLIVWMRGNEHAHWPCKFFAWLVFILAIIALIWTGVITGTHCVKKCQQKTAMMQKCKMKHGNNMMQQKMPMKKMHKKH